MRRVAIWLGIVTLLAAAHVAHDSRLRGASLVAAVMLFGILTPAALRVAVGVVAAVAILIGAGLGMSALLDAVPALIACFVAWMFARTLVPARRPLVARAIAALDGPAQLDDAAIARYARRLTWVWMLWQSALAVLGIVVLLYAKAWPGTAPAWLPGVPVYGLLILPLGVIGLFTTEFALRARILPQAPRHSLWWFTCNLLRVWPRLLED